MISYSGTAANKEKNSSNDRVDKEDLAYLPGRMKILLELTKKICQAKIGSFGAK